MRVFPLVVMSAVLAVLVSTACRGGEPGITANCNKLQTCEQLEPPNTVETCIREEQKRLDVMNADPECQDAGIAYDRLAACSARLDCEFHNFNGVAQVCRDEVNALSQAGGANCGQ